MKILQVNILFCAFILFFCCASDPGWASDYKATQDSYINGGSAGFQHGGLDSLRVENRGNTLNDLSYSKKAYIEFDISSHGEQVHQAELRLHVLPGEDVVGDADDRLWTFALYGLHESYKLNESYDTWLQMALRWDNAPGNDDELGGAFLTQCTTLLDTFTIDGVGDGEIITLTGDDGSELIQFLQSDTNGRVTFLIGRSTPGQLGRLTTHRFASAEYDPPDGPLGQDAPQLTILPEPATISLFCLGAVALLRRSRKHA
jgi:hypothetical protein